MVPIPLAPPFAVVSKIDGLFIFSSFTGPLLTFEGNRKGRVGAKVSGLFLSEKAGRRWRS